MGLTFYISVEFCSWLGSEILIRVLHQYVCILQQDSQIVFLVLAFHVLDFVLQRITQIIERRFVRVDFLVVSVFSRKKHPTEFFKHGFVPVVESLKCVLVWVNA
jgi:hypothetical protein